jgi:hypothetical protein
MKAYTLRIGGLLLSIGLIAGVASGQQPPAHDGYWWTNSNEGFQIGFVNGYLMAMKTAGDSATFNCIAEKNGGVLPAKAPDNATLTTCINSANARPFMVFSGFRVGQWKDGVDEFYKDSRNKSLDVQLAMRYVAQQLRGTPATELEKEVIDWRRLAAK